MRLVSALLLLCWALPQVSAQDSSAEEASDEDMGEMMRSAYGAPPPPLPAPLIYLLLPAAGHAPAYGPPAAPAYSPPAAPYSPPAAPYGLPAAHYQPLYLPPLPAPHGYAPAPSAPPPSYYPPAVYHPPAAAYPAHAPLPPLPPAKPANPYQPKTFAYDDDGYGAGYGAYKPPPAVKCLPLKKPLYHKKIIYKPVVHSYPLPHKDYGYAPPAPAYGAAGY